MIVLNDLRAALVIHSFIFILLVLRSHIVLVVIMLLSMAQSVRIFAHWRLHLVLSGVQVVLGERSLPVLLQEVVASH